MSANVRIEISDLLGVVDLNGIEVLDSDQVERLEHYISLCNSAMSDKHGMPLVEDAVYDRLVDILKDVKPESELLLQVWSEDSEDEDVLLSEYNRLLNSDPMMSIQTIKDLNSKEFQDFIKRLPETSFDLHYAMKENGFGIRVVYEWGKLVLATTRGRATAGRDITRHMKLILGEYNETLSEIDLCEVRGELLLPLSRLGQAREFNPSIKTAFTGVSSLCRESATDEEIALLDFVAYRILSDDINFDTKSQEYEALEDCGFETPLYFVQEGVTRDTVLESVESALSDLEDEMEEYEYFTDGVVCEIDSRNIFADLGDDGGKYNLGNIALKVGYWRQDLYSGFVQDIEWTFGKLKFSPVALISEFMDAPEEEWGVLTGSGNRVKRVPLYEPNNILLLEAYVGSPLYFRYGGEAGVVPCFPDGTPLSEAKIESMLDGNEDDEYTELDFSL